MIFDDMHRLLDANPTPEILAEAQRHYQDFVEQAEKGHIAEARNRFRVQLERLIQEALGRNCCG